MASPPFTEPFAGPRAETIADFVESRLGGFFDPAFVATRRVELTIDEGPAEALAPEATPTTRIHDARRLQAAAVGPSYSEARFFEQHGFVLLSHESAVADWDVDPNAPDNELVRVYLPEIETLIRSRLLAGRRIDLWQGPPVRRGPGTPNPQYALGVHQDFGLTPDDYQEAIEAFTSPELGQAWRDRYDHDDVIGFVSIDFWRTAGMHGPLHHMPLTLCAPASVRIDDVVPIGLLNFTPSGKPTNQLGLRYQDDQRWYYYPEMEPDEVLAFKQFQCLKDDREPRVACCFHSAFELPNTPADTEERQSSEHRVQVFLLRD